MNPAQFSAVQLTRILKDWTGGDASALERLTPVVYAELHRLAYRSLAGERDGHLLQPSALVNEAFVRLMAGQPVEWTSRAHFFAHSARLMRQILIDFARAQDTGKRGHRSPHVDLSADGSEMLLGQYLNDVADHFPLFAAAALGGPARRIGELTSNDARWSPKGDEIVYCASPELRIARRDGSESRLLVKLDGYMRSPAWSPDGRFVRFTLDRNGVPALWEVAADGTSPARTFSRNGRPPARAGPGDARRKVFRVLGPRNFARHVGHATECAFFAAERFKSYTADKRAAISGPAASQPGRPQDFFRGRLERAELVRYDRVSSKWTKYLHGLPAMQVDFSRDGRWIAYASYRDAAVWRCAADGSGRVPLTSGPLFARNPRFSPDGRQIVFYGAPPGKPDRVYLVKPVEPEQLENGGLGLGMGGTYSGQFSHFHERCGQY